MRTKGYAILHLPTGKYLPQMKRGSTQWNPETSNETIFPQLYRNRKAAGYVANSWARGKIEPMFVRTPSGDEYKGTVQIPVEGRHRHDLAIVEIELRAML